MRVPASFCGILGFRPSHGRLSLDGVMPFAPSYDTIGWFARDGAILARVGEALLGAPAAARPRRLLLIEDPFALSDPACVAALRKAAEALGARSAVTLFAGEEAQWLECYRVLQGAEIWRCLGPWIMATKPRCGEAIAPRFADAATIAPGLVAAFTPIRAGITAGIAELLAPDTALVLPTTPGIALPKGLRGPAIGDFYRRALTLTCIAGHAGLPQASLPLAAVDGCPLGLSIIAAGGADEGLLALAAEIIPRGDREA